VVGLRRGTSGASGVNRNLGPCLFYRDSAGSRGPSRIGRDPKVLPSTFGLLSWGSSKIAPPPVQMSCVHSRAGRGPSFGSKLPHSELVPPLPFLSTSAVYSAGHPAGLLHPATGHGVRHVSGSPLPFARRLRGGGLPFPWCTTLRSFPLRDSALRVTAFRCPLVVVSGFRSWVRPCCHVCPRVHLPVARPQGFGPPRSPLQARQRCR
jgi:hypothetical protein